MLPLLVSQEIPVQVHIVLVNSAVVLEAERIQRVHEHDGGQSCAATIGGVESRLHKVLQGCILDSTAYKCECNIKCAYSVDAISNVCAYKSSVVTNFNQR